MLDQVSRLCPAHNEASVDKNLLPRALEAFDLIAQGRAPEFEEEGTVYHGFEGFNVALPG